ncbi:MAG TPA: hypothetical protein VIX81_10995 [Gammaproteobacteria bacterium]
MPILPAAPGCGAYGDPADASPLLFAGRWQLLWLPSLAVSTATRLLLALGAGAEAGLDARGTRAVFAVGALYDLAFVGHASLPLVLCLWLAPERLWRSRAGALLRHAAVLLTLAVLLFTALAEWIFRDEFHARFNFIAVDHLVYTHEVLANILMPASPASPRQSVRGPPPRQPLGAASGASPIRNS